MKAILLIVTLLIASSAFAGRINEDSSLSDIYYSDNYDFDMPQYWIGGNTSIWATEVCVDGEKIRTKTTRNRCTKHVPTHGGDNGWKCVKREDIYLYAPINYTSRYCTEWDSKQDHCIGEWKVENKRLPLSFDIDVFKAKMTGDGDKVRDPFVKFTKHLEVPNC